LHHSVLKSGWAGVDIFFVLSGFLITGILRRERVDAAFSRTFYTKRAARLLPPLLLLFPAVLVMHRHFAAGSLGYLLFGGNLLQLTRYRLADKTFRRTTDSLLFNSIGYSLVIAASFFLLAHVVLNPRSRMARCLSVRPMVFIGTISYGFYLYQEAVMNAVRWMAGHNVSLR